MKMVQETCLPVTRIITGGNFIALPKMQLDTTFIPDIHISPELMLFKNWVMLGLVRRDKRDVKSSAGNYLIPL